MKALLVVLLLRLCLSQPINDDLNNAILLDLSIGIIAETGDTSTATLEPLDECFIPNNAAGNVWYRIIPTGLNTYLTLSLCNVETLYDTTLVAFNGNSPNNLFCYFGNDNDPNCSNNEKSGFSIFIPPSEDLYIGIGGPTNTDVGEFK